LFAPLWQRKVSAWPSDYKYTVKINAAKINYMKKEGSHYSLDWTTGLDYWTHPKCCKMPFQVFFSVGEKLTMLIQPTSLLNLFP